MALVTVTRSPICSSNLQQSTPTIINDSTDNGPIPFDNNSVSENYVALKGAALILPLSDYVNRKLKSIETKIHQHLQLICDLLRINHCLKIAVNLESINTDHYRYMALIVPNDIKNISPVATILGIDILPETVHRPAKASIGLIFPLYNDFKVKLCHDGYFIVKSRNEQHFFKPISVQVLWAALQSLYKCQKNFQRFSNVTNPISNELWSSVYSVSSVYANVSEWNKSCELAEIKYSSPILDLNKTDDELSLQNRIEEKLRQVMLEFDLDEVTTVTIRNKLENDFGIDLHKRKTWIDEKMLTILEQFNQPSEICDYLLLGSEGNACDLRELRRQNVTHILNVTTEIDNFFPNENFSYYNVRVHDDDKARLLNHWDTTNLFILEAKKRNTKVLVHCKMGISRSSSTVIAHLMKYSGMSVEKAYEYVKERRNIIRPNQNFLRQLHEYEAILNASKHRDKFGRIISPLDTTIALRRPSLTKTCSFSVSDLRDKKSDISSGIETAARSAREESNCDCKRERNSNCGVKLRSPKVRNLQLVSRSQSLKAIDCKRWSGNTYQEYENLEPGIVSRRSRAFTEYDEKANATTTTASAASAAAAAANNFNNDQNKTITLDNIPSGIVQLQTQIIERNTPPQTPGGTIRSGVNKDSSPSPSVSPIKENCSPTRRPQLPPSWIIQSKKMDSKD